MIAVYGWSALHWAANGGHDEAVRLLVAPRAQGGGAAQADCLDWKNWTVSFVFALHCRCLGPPAWRP